jgi:hypothetical protein
MSGGPSTSTTHSALDPCGVACDVVDLTLTPLDRLPRGAAILVGVAGTGRPWP